ATLRE
ncbi:hypothetical protein CFC21_088410, partial [Triticum aestivum]